jgi:hypothetical protein
MKRRKRKGQLAFAIDRPFFSFPAVPLFPPVIAHSRIKAQKALRLFERSNRQIKEGATFQTGTEENT